MKFSRENLRPERSRTQKFSLGAAPPRLCSAHAHAGVAGRRCSGRWSAASHDPLLCTIHSANEQALISVVAGRSGVADICCWRAEIAAAQRRTSVFILVDVCWRAAAYKLLPRAFQTLFLTRVMHTPQAALDSTANASDFQHRPSAAGSGSSTFDAFPAEKKSVNLHFCRKNFYGWNARACSRRFEICNSHLLIPSGSRAGRGQSSGVS